MQSAWPRWYNRDGVWDWRFGDAKRPQVAVPGVARYRSLLETAFLHEPNPFYKTYARLLLSTDVVRVDDILYFEGGGWRAYVL